MSKAPSKPTPRDGGSKPTSIAAKAMSNGGNLTKAETLTIAASVMSQNQHK